MKTITLNIEYCSQCPKYKRIDNGCRFHIECSETKTILYDEVDGSYFSKIPDNCPLEDITPDEDINDHILVENGAIFDGSRDQFMDNFFTNANNEEIKDWCFDNSWSLTIEGKIIFE